MRYRVDDLPAIGVGAFTPIPATNPVASSYGLVGITASWGTDPAPAPKPQGLPASNTAQGKPNTARNSDVVPDAILPAIAIPATRNMGPEADAGFGMTRRRVNELPMPAVDPARVPTPAQSPAHVGGRSVLAWPRAFQTWPLRSAGAS